MEKKSNFIQTVITQTWTTRQLFNSQAEDENDDDDDDKEYSADDRQDDNKLEAVFSRWFHVNSRSYSQTYTSDIQN